MYMEQVTQGTIIYGLRSRKYSDTICNGIVITAKCDLSNSKTDKIYYITAIPTKQWLISNAGYSFIISTGLKSKNNSIMKLLQQYQLDWEILHSFSKRERITVLNDRIANKKEVEKIVKEIKEYEELMENDKDKDKIKSLLESNRNYWKTDFVNVMQNHHTHYTFMPQLSYETDGSNVEGLIVDHLDIDYFLPEELEKIQKNEMDEKTLTEKEKTRYRNRYFFNSNPGFAMVNGAIKSPWVEFLLQRFSNSFVRIGVDNPSKELVIRYQNEVEL